ncbi:MAG TPA: guanylate kinase [Sphingobacteriaceae bacterium]|nr:guanylate kinase [Sphingobacteriaceae bacterium]
MNKTLPGLLIVLSAPSGAGKGSVRRELAKLEPDLIYGVSVTTRPPRPGERDGQHYFFTDEEDFRARAARGELVEWSEVYGHLYGTPREPMETYIREGRDVIVEKDVQGARKIMALYPKAVTIFILPPSLEELRRRIESRGTESPEAQRQRLRSAGEELVWVKDYQYCIVNDDVAVAAADVAAIIRAERCRVQRYLDAGHLFWLEG